MCAITSPHSDASADQHMLLAMVGAGKMREFRELPTRQEKEQRVELLGGLVDFLREKWELEMPSVIFSVTGSAQELTLRPKFRDTVSRHDIAGIVARSLLASGLHSSKSASNIVADRSCQRC